MAAASSSARQSVVMAFPTRVWLVVACRPRLHFVVTTRMKIRHVRSATMMIEVDGANILVDPMLGRRGTILPFALLRHSLRLNPVVALPGGSEEILESATHCLITHCRRAHFDHLDGAGKKFLRSKQIPVFCTQEDQRYLERRGIRSKGLRRLQTNPFLGGEVTPVPAQHGWGWLHYLMANGVGYFLRIPGHPSLYVSGDTVLTNDVKMALTTLRPDISVVAAGGASLDVGRPILMSLEEVVEFVRLAPGKVIANHLEALNHCPTTREQLRRKLDENGLLHKVAIPEDGELIAL